MTEDVPGRAALADGLAALGLAPTAEAIQKLLAYDRLLQRWNRVYNLTRIPGSQSIAYQLLDSLAIMPYLAGSSLVDVGSGGGLPGIPLAICNPELAVTLLDSNGKKARFLEQARIELGLANLSVQHARVEAFEGSFDMVTCRAFAPLGEICNLTGHLLAPGGRILAMKGTLEREEMSSNTGHLRLSGCHELIVPGIEGRRQLVVVEHS